MVNPHMGMTAAIADRVSSEPNGRPPSIVENTRLRGEHQVMPVRGNQDEEPAMAEILNARQTRLLPPQPRPTGEVHLIPLDELAVYVSRILVLGHLARDVEPVSSAHIADGQLLDESFGSNGDTAVHDHQSRITREVLQREKAVVSGTTAKALNLLTFRESTGVRSMLAEPLNSPHRNLLSRAAASVCVTPCNSLPELCVLTP